MRSQALRPRATHRPKSALEPGPLRLDAFNVDNADSNAMTWQDSWVLETPPRFVLPLAGPYGALLIVAIAFLSLS